MSVFNELKTSLEEAADIEAGSRKASRVTRYTVVDVKAVREQLSITQVELAAALSTSVDTIKSWETKRRNPTGLAAKVLTLIRDNPALYQEISAR
ncbi:NadS family protein [Parahaliea mediterranea]|uniref:NadS family protein n=1 Tax=Parahaliea mediterranea TaxID=651086 RepID=UPI000E2ED4C9|nr:NadS family protein [Parahaliea mediterranea]